MKKILLVGTSGGHLTQALTLFSEISDENKIVFSEASNRLTSLRCKTYSQKRYPYTLLHMALCGIKCLYIILKEKPQWVITPELNAGLLLSSPAKYYSAKRCLLKRHPGTERKPFRQRSVIL